MNPNIFDPAVTPLQSGISLIEASAGTGKTYTITMLVLRLVVEFNIPIEKILVVTFTKAATEELKSRIRTRLTEAKKALFNDQALEDKNLNHWLCQLNINKEIIKTRINLALLDFDKAGIFTIHGFCQRILKEHALTSGQMFDAELSEDINAIRQNCADDFWRQTMASCTPWQAGVLTHYFATPEQLLQSIAIVPEDALVVPDPGSLPDVFFELKQLANEAAKTILAISKQIQAVVNGKEFKSSYQSDFSDNLDLMTGWLQGVTAQFPGDSALRLLTYQGRYDGLNGNQFRGNKIQTSDERKTEFLQSLNIDTELFNNLATRATEISILVRRNLMAELRTEMDKQLTAINAWSFDSLITHLAKALDGTQSANLKAELQRRFQAALIDEFQDTDDNQWHIFSNIFASNRHYLLLVGDPKQAIYKFRGADIYSYLTAQGQAQHRYTLAYNWRSHPHLVEGINQLFQQDDLFLIPAINFHRSSPGLTEQDGYLTYRDEHCPPLVLWHLPENDSSKGYWTAGVAGGAIQTTVANEILNLLQNDFRLQPINRTIKPKDIAILVRANHHAKSYQDALRLAGIPAVLNSTESVFASEEANHLFILLQAIVHPGDSNLLRQALALSWFGHDGQALCQLYQNDNELAAILVRFQGYWQLWQQQGVMAMMQTVLRQENITSVLSKSKLAERQLTNLQHILELLEQAILDQHLGIQKSLNWLKTMITDANPLSSEIQQLRLESDDDAVAIVTMHRAKGLEYPIVFCPYLWHSRQRESTRSTLVKCHLPDKADRHRLLIDLGSDQIEQHRNQERLEDQAEELRLAYVALTRAKYRCYVPWANVRTQEKPNESTLATLLGIGNLGFSEQQQALQRFVLESPKSFTYELINTASEAISPYLRHTAQLRLSARKRRRTLYSHWQMSSYSALSALSPIELTELPLDKAGEDHNQYADGSVDLPAGAVTGNVVHKLLETISFEDLGSTTNISVARNLACHQFGLTLHQPEVIDLLLQNTVNTALSHSEPVFCLKNIPGDQCLKEMPFYLSLSSIKTKQINTILQHEPTFQALNNKQMHGYLTGFIDLVCEYSGQFYVMDYKTNSLPNYAPTTLLEAMREHNYGLQYWLYCVVLHRYLTHRLADYEFTKHFGGVRYLFVRGMNPTVAMSGVFATEPDCKTLIALSDLFGN